MNTNQSKVSRYKAIDGEIGFINELASKQSGSVLYDGKSIVAEIEKKDEVFMYRIGDIIDFDIDGIEFDFTSENCQLLIDAPITAHRNSLKVKEKLVSRYSEGEIYSFRNKVFEKKQANYQRGYYYLGKDKLIYDYFGSISFIRINVNGNQYLISCVEKYLVVESVEIIDYEIFSENCYNIMIAIGFVSGDFIQNETYTFQRTDKESQEFSGYEYRQLRSSSHSIYHPLTHNPFSYGRFIGREIAEQLSENKSLKPCDEVSFSKLVELIENNSQIQYALVLFNEANNNSLSLLIQNNCFYAVFEVLKKFFAEKFKGQLPMGYSNAGNIEKYKIIFSNLISLTDEEFKTLEKRNFFLHGDIKNMKTREMVDIMQKQITLIYRLVFTYIGFDGYIIDHYAMRNMPERAFIKVN